MNTVHEHWHKVLVLVSALATASLAQDRTPPLPPAGASPADPYLLLQPPPPIKPGEVRWLAQLDTALIEARVRNLPVFVVCGNDASPVMQAMLEGVYLKPSFAAINDLAVPVIALTGLQHPSSETTENGRTFHLCGYFKVPCEDHDRLLPQIRERYVTRQFSIPLHIYLQSTADEFLRLEGEHTEKRLLGELRRLMKTLGPSLNYKTYVALVGGVQEVRDLLKAHQARAALQKYQIVLHGAPSQPSVAQWLQAELDRLLLDGRDRLRIATKLLQTRRKAEALEMVAAVASDYEGYPVADEAAALRAEIEKN